MTAIAAPSRLIILRHGEKADPWKLCDIGEQRAEALALTYLGKNAAKSLFANGEEPAFFFAITLHTIELASPSVASWNKPLILYSVVPESGESKEDFTKKLNQRTQEAARGLLDNPALKGKTVVVVWEHKHIANEELDTKFEREGVTLRQLLNLDILPGVPKTWPEDTYDYFWIVDFPPDFERAVQVHHGEAGVRHLVPERAGERLGRARRPRRGERLQDQGLMTVVRSPSRLEQVAHIGRRIDAVFISRPAALAPLAVWGAAGQADGVELSAACRSICFLGAQAEFHQGRHQGYCQQRNQHSHRRSPHRKYEDSPRSGDAEGRV